jgi:hypothetical protein
MGITAGCFVEILLSGLNHAGGTELTLLCSVLPCNTRQ